MSGGLSCDTMITVVGSGGLAQRLSAELGATGPVALIEASGEGNAEGRVGAVGAIASGVVVAVMQEDERNLVAAAVAKRRGAARVAAVVRSVTLAGDRELAASLGIDRVIQPQAEIAAALVTHLRGPVVSAVRSLGSGRVRVAELMVGAGCAGAMLKDLKLPAGSRVAVIHRGEGVVAPGAGVRINEEDRVLLVANASVLGEAVGCLGGRAVGEGLRASIVAVEAMEEARCLAAALGEMEVMAEVARGKGLSAGELLVVCGAGPDGAEGKGRRGGRAFLVAEGEGVRAGPEVVRLSPTREVARAVRELLPCPPVERVGAIAAGVLDVYRVECGEGGAWLEAPLREIPEMKGWTVLAVQVGDRAYLPHPDDVIGAGEVLMIAGPPGGERVLERGLRGAEGRSVVGAR